VIHLKHAVTTLIVTALFFAGSADYTSVNSYFNYAPASRTVRPTAIFKTNGTVTNATNVLSGNATRISGNGSYITADFGKEVGGIVTLSFSGASGSGQSVGLAFSESSIYVGTASDASNGGSGADGAIFATVNGAGSYTMPANKLRGGFRYLTVFMNSTGWVDLDTISLNYTIAPAMSVPSAYLNYFFCNDTLITRIWYAGAYTAQSNCIAPASGRVWPAPATGWDNSATLGSGVSILVDGAKRDRLIWPGDMGIAVPSCYYSTGDVISAKNSLISLYNQQQNSGELPYVAPPVGWFGSDMYHMWALAGTYKYYLFSGDRTWLNTIWSKYRQGVRFSTGKIGADSLMSVTGTADWARGGQGGENIEANSLLYVILTQSAVMAAVESNTTFGDSCAMLAARLKSAVNKRIWDGTKGAYKDNPTSTMYPQDGNSLAIWFGVVDDTAKAAGICTYLRSNWSTYGSRTPEWSNNIATFPGSMEAQAHFAANDDSAGLVLVKREWGYMLNSPIGTKSSFWEGYNADSTFAYSGNYMSCSHGWASGPTSALSAYVLGIKPLSAAGKTWSVEPHCGTLTHAEGRLVLSGDSMIEVSWDRPGTDTFSLSVNSSTAIGSAGTVSVPRFGKNHVVYVNGVPGWDGTAFMSAAGITGASQDNRFITFTGIAPGARVFSLGRNATGACMAPKAAVPSSKTLGLTMVHGNAVIRVNSVGPYVLQVFDALGTVRAEYRGQGNTSIIVPERTIPFGMCFVRLKDPGIVIIRKFVLH
jgi:hypothetical protein